MKNIKFVPIVIQIFFCVCKWLNYNQTTWEPAKNVPLEMQKLYQHSENILQNLIDFTSEQLTDDQNSMLNIQLL